MNIEGLSEATLEKFLNLGYLQTFHDIYHLDHHREEIIRLEGFGEKSFDRALERNPGQPQHHLCPLSDQHGYSHGRPYKKPGIGYRILRAVWMPSGRLPPMTMISHS